MTAQDHWRRLYTSLRAHTGPLWVARSLLASLAAVLRTAGMAPGMEALSRAGNLFGEAVDAIDSAAFLARLGCPVPGKRGEIVIDTRAGLE